MDSASHPTPRRSFEGLFRYALKPDAALKVRLKQAGYDPDDPQLTYPTEVYKRCLNLAREHLCPNDPEPEGWRKLGHLWVEGFTHTAVGTVLAAAARLIGPERMLARLASYLHAGREDLRIDVQALAPRHWRVMVTDPVEPRPHLTRGILEELMMLAGVKDFTVDLVVDGPTGYELHVKWR